MFLEPVLMKVGTSDLIHVLSSACVSQRMINCTKRGIENLMTVAQQMYTLHFVVLMSLSHLITAGK